MVNMAWVDRRIFLTGHSFNYNLMKNEDGSGDFIKKPNKQMRSVWAINTSKNGEKNMVNILHGNLKFW